MSQVRETVIKLLTENPHLNNDDVAEKVRELIPGATTTAASVSSIKSTAKKSGDLDGTTLALAAAANRSANMPEVAPIELLPDETDEERSDRIRRRFNTLERMAWKIAEGRIPALIVSGPPGLGKSFTVEEVMKDKYGTPVGYLDEEFDEENPTYDIISGAVTAPGLILSLWSMRNGGTVVLDDCDDVFRDETCLNILKAVLDSSDVRRVSYRKRAHWMEEEGIPQTFEFKGQVVFCTNIDFEAAIAKGSSMGPHFEALIDRSLYVALTLRTKADFITRIHHVALEDGLLNSKGLDDDEAQEVFEFIVQRADDFYGLSLRLVGQVADAYASDPETWKDDVEATKMRTFKRRAA